MRARRRISLKKGTDDPDTEMRDGKRAKADQKTDVDRTEFVHSCFYSGLLSGNRINKPLWASWPMIYDDEWSISLGRRRTLNMNTAGDSLGSSFFHRSPSFSDRSFNLEYTTAGPDPYFRAPTQEFSIHDSRDGVDDICENSLRHAAEVSLMGETT